MCVCVTNSYVKALILSVFEGRAFGKYLDLDEVMRVWPQ